MGNLLKVLTYNELDQGPNFFLDFENAQPTEAETAVWNQVNAVLEEAQAVLAELQSYTGAGQEIREAIQNPAEAASPPPCIPLLASHRGGRRGTGGALSPENALRSLLEALTSPPYAPTQHLEREQALAKQFAEILHFTLSFDELKGWLPGWGWHRGDTSGNPTPCPHPPPSQLDAESEVNNEMANRMSLFYAEATPMLKTLSNATTKFVSENKTLPIEDTTDCLSTMACVCRVMLETPTLAAKQFLPMLRWSLLCSTSTQGRGQPPAAHPGSHSLSCSLHQMKGCIKVLKDQPSTSTEGLLNALRYTTRHLNDDTTSKQIRALLQ
ncbi:Protein FAM49B [Dryobates pubescens]|uniref:Protein FAM49B n=1 Tax=Dryobates pubescens TaxID=118200 RepID=A0A093J809_DRYPU|nr:Protein FAM49B [Dryobates pubescens]